MNRDTLKGQWKQLAGKAKTQWAKLTEDDWLRVEGNIDQLSGRIQERYGLAREKADEEIDAFVAGSSVSSRPVGGSARDRAAAGL